MDEPTPEQRTSARDRANRLADFWATRDDISLSADAVFDLEQSFLALIVERDRLRAENEAMRRALQPFAQRADYFDERLKANGGKWEDEDPYYEDDHPRPDGPWIGQLRAARDAVRAAEAITRKEEPSDASNQPE